MTKGGYQILDLKNLVIKSVGGGEYNSINIPGIYEKIKGTNKPILVTGVVWGDQEGTVTIGYRDFFSTPIPADQVSGDGYAEFETNYPNSYLIKLPYTINRESGISAIVVQENDNVTAPKTI